MNTLWMTGSLILLGSFISRVLTKYSECIIMLQLNVANTIIPFAATTDFTEDA